MIKRLLIVLGVGVGIPFVPYFIGSNFGWILFEEFNKEKDSMITMWTYGFTTLFSILILSILLLFAIKYIIKGN